MLQRLYPAGFVFEDLAGTTPAAAGTVYVYLNTTTTLATIYSNTTGTTRSNPITLGADGRLPTDVYVTDWVTVRLREYHVTPASGVLVFTKDNMPNLVPDADDILYTDGTVDRTINSKLSDFFHVKDYGAVGDGATDDTAAIIAACSAIQTNGGGTLLFDPKTYLIYPTGTLSGSITMNTFTNCKAIHIDFRGATLSIQDVFANAEFLYLFMFSGCRHITLENASFVQTPAAKLVTVNSGHAPFYFKDATRFIQIRNIHQTGGLAGLECVRDTADADPTDKVSDLSIENCYYSLVGYPLSFQNSGDRVFGRNLHMSECFRPYFPYGVRFHDVELTADNSQNPSVMYGGYGSDAECAFLEDMTVKIRSNKNGIGGAIQQAPALHVIASWRTDRNTPAQIRNINVTLDVEMVPDLALYSIFELHKIANDGTADATDHGHIIENVTIGGTITNADSGGSAGVLQLMSTGLGTWSTGDYVRNLRVKDLVVTPSAAAATYIAVGLGSIVDHLMIENVQMPAALTTNGTAQLGIIYKNCILGGVVYSDVINSLQTITGSGAVDITHRLTNLNTTGGGTYTLADGYEGLRKTITMTVDSGTDGVVTPSTFVGNPSATITFNDVGDTAELLFTAGAWVFLGGTATVA